MRNFYALYEDKESILHVCMIALTIFSAWCLE
jgi:hypothetical protein